MADPFIGEVIMFAGNFAPSGWAFCDGQLLPISANTALFSILGTTYGGDGQSNFALPDLRGRVPVGPRTGPGLAPVTLGEKAGNANHNLTVGQMPAHRHAVMCDSGPANRAEAVGNYPSMAEAWSNAQNDSMNPEMIGQSGGGQPFSLMQPYLGINFIIALFGVFPSPN